MRIFGWCVKVHLGHDPGAWIRPFLFLIRPSHLGATRRARQTLKQGTKEDSMMLNKCASPRQDGREFTTLEEPKLRKLSEVSPRRNSESQVDKVNEIVGFIDTAPENRMGAHEVLGETVTIREGDQESQINSMNNHVGLGEVLIIPRAVELLLLDVYLRKRIVESFIVRHVGVICLWQHKAQHLYSSIRARRLACPCVALHAYPVDSGGWRG
jgi:hypothetical protein